MADVCSKYLRLVFRKIVNLPILFPFAQKLFCFRRMIGLIGVEDWFFFLVHNPSIVWMKICYKDRHNQTKCTQSRNINILVLKNSITLKIQLFFLLTLTTLPYEINKIFRFCSTTKNLINYKRSIGNLFKEIEFFCKITHYTNIRNTYMIGFHVFEK